MSVHILQAPVQLTDGRQWHIMTCEPNLERRAEDRLRQYLFRCYLPKRMAKQKYGTRGGPKNRKRTREVLRPIVPGYIFVAFSFMADQSRRDTLRRVPGLKNFLCIAGEPTIVTHTEIQKLFTYEYETAMGKRPVGQCDRVNVGDRVRVTEGPFLDHVGYVDQLDGEDGLSILFELLGRKVPVALDLDQVEKL